MIKMTNEKLEKLCNEIRAKKKNGYTFSIKVLTILPKKYVI